MSERERFDGAEPEGRAGRHGEAARRNRAGDRSAFEELARVLASPMPRRRAFKLAIATVAAAGLGRIGLRAGPAYAGGVDCSEFCYEFGTCCIVDEVDAHCCFGEDLCSSVDGCCDPADFCGPDSVCCVDQVGCCGQDCCDVEGGQHCCFDQCCQFDEECCGGRDPGCCLAGETCVGGQCSSCFKGRGTLESATGPARARFDFHAGRRAGRLDFNHLTYEDNALRVYGEGMTSYEPLSKTSARFEGPARVNGVHGYRYTVEVHDNTPAGSKDRFRIALTSPRSGYAYSASGPVVGGAIELHLD